MNRLVLLVVLVLFASVGCGGGPVETRKPTMKARCTVRLEDGTVPKDAIVIFHPQEEGGFSPYRPRGKVQANGETLLTTYTLNDGIPAGEYIVTVVWPVQQEGKRRENADDDVDQLDDRYSQPSSSPLKRTIKPGDREIEPIVLSR